MVSHLIVSLWIVFMAALIALFIVRAKLISRLRNDYSTLYASIGSPIAFSRSLDFLWRLQPYQDQLSAKDLNLLRLNLTLFYTGAVVALLFVACLFI